MTTAEQQFYRDALVQTADAEKRQMISRGMDSWAVAFDRARQRVTDWEAARTRSARIKREALANLADLLEQFESKVRARGGHVFWAENAEEACAYICDLAKARDVKTVVKSKSMVTEEIHLSEALEQRVGATVWETDLGEFIVQLRHEPPYHIVTPAMHLTRGQISDLFREKLDPSIDFDDPAELTAVARRKLRQAFFAADMGISGANFIVADAGMIAISTNEGNGRLTTSVPRIHVCVTGIEKVIARLEDLAVLWPVLATAGTGQPITTYGTLIGAAREDGEPGGPEEFHVVLVDNGRTRALANPDQHDVLRCIRCGACMNVCPVFKQIGGHTYGAVYPGPIGSVLMPLLGGEEKFGHLPFASSLCTACTDVCPVRIDLAKHLLQHRHYQGDLHKGHRPASERRMFSMFRWMMMSPGRLRFGAALAKRGAGLLRLFGIDPMKDWTKYRAPIEFPKHTFRELWKKENANGAQH